jgi:hypothetical protein
MSLISTYEPAVKDIADNKNAKLIIKSMMGLNKNSKVQFPAFLTSFTQNFTSTWNEEDVYGRMDPIATFQNTRRSVSLSFDLPAANLSIAKANLKECDRLAQFLYPSYITQKDIGGGKKDLGNIIAKPPLVSVKFANLISSGATDATSSEANGLLGYLLGLEWTPALDMGMFSDKKNNLFPKVISLSFSLNVLHQNDKGFKSNGDWISNTFFGGHQK